MTDEEMTQLAINTIRTLSIDAVQQAKSGHPGTPMALAPLIYTIWNRVMRFDPEDPVWPNRDRFVLSNGHASMLLWSVLHLTRTKAVNANYERLGHVSVSLDDSRHFRQLDSKAPGHPEYHWVSGVETTTGPLGQGGATSVGMAISYWQPLDFELPRLDSAGENPWRRWIDTALDSPHDILEWAKAEPLHGYNYRAESRSVVMLYGYLI
jgi:transketolase